jgi:hypothetical protein
MLRTLNIELPIAAQNLVRRAMRERGFEQMRDFHDYLTDDWQEVSHDIAMSLGEYLALHDIYFAGISLQVSERRRLHFRLRDLERSHAIRVGALILSWADENMRQYGELQNRLSPVVDT